jgi:hypothetical protein
MKTKLFFIVLISIVIFNDPVFGQKINPKDEIKKTLSAEDLTVIQESDDNFLSAENFAKLAFEDFEKARDLRQKSETVSKKEAKKLLKQAEKLEKNCYSNYEKASVLYEKSYKAAYNVYKRNLSLLVENCELEKKRNIVDYQKDAVDFYKKSVSDRNKASRSKSASEKYSLLRSADGTAKTAVETEIKAIDDYYEWSSTALDLEKKATEDSVKIAQNSAKDTLNLSSINENEFDIYKPDTLKKITNVESEKPNNVIFKVQFAASNNELSTPKLRQILPGNTVINNEKDGDWYKYTFGNFKTYEEAWNAKKNMNISGSFVVAYKDGKRSDVRQTVSAEEFTKMSGNIASGEKSNAGTGRYEYRIQIGMSRLPADDVQLKKINPTTDPVKISHSGGWYKYTVGSFTSEQEAENFKKNHGLSKSKIVHFLGDTQIQ